MHWKHLNLGLAAGVGNCDCTPLMKQRWRTQHEWVRGLYVVRHLASFPGCVGKKKAAKYRHLAHASMKL